MDTPCKPFVCSTRMSGRWFTFWGTQHARSSRCPSGYRASSRSDSWGESQLLFPLPFYLLCYPFRWLLLRFPAFSGGFHVSLQRSFAAFSNFHTSRVNWIVGYSGWHAEHSIRWSRLFHSLHGLGPDIYDVPISENQDVVFSSTMKPFYVSSSCLRNFSNHFSQELFN